MIGLTVYTFARVGATTSMNVEDLYFQNRKWWVRLHQKGGKLHQMPAQPQSRRVRRGVSGSSRCRKREGHSPLSDGSGKTGAAHGPTNDPVGRVSHDPRRATGPAIKTLIGCHTFRATGIAAYLSNGGKLEVAQQMAAHESARTTGLYDRRGDDISLDEVERIAI